MTDELTRLRSELTAAAAREAVLREALEPVRAIYCPAPDTNTKRDEFERGAPLSPAQIRAMQAALNDPAPLADAMMKVVEEGEKVTDSQSFVGQAFSDAVSAYTALRDRRGT